MDANVAYNFDVAVELFPFNVAVQSEQGDITLTYEALRDKVSLISQCLRGYNHVSSSLVAIQMHRGAGIVAAMLGVLKAELVYVPIDPKHPVDRQKYIMNHSKCLKLITDPDNYSRICEYNLSYAQIIIVNFDDGSIVGVVEKNPDQEPIFCAETNAAYVLYTSGSTGRPKGVVVKNCSLANTVHYFADLLHAGPGDVVLALTTFCFDISMLEIYVPLTTGATVVVGTSTTQRNPSMLVSIFNY
jgi:non-ribosomal peptide synthetase component F